jgi:hypothetical protein
MENISYQNAKTSDPIASLPTDKQEPTPTELHVIHTLFNDNNNKKSMAIIFSEAKESLIVGILFVILTIPQVDTIINKILPMTEKSSYILLLVKIFIIMLLFWLVKHFYLAKK